MSETRTNPDESSHAFGPNAWLIEEKYRQFREFPDSVGDHWRNFLAGAKGLGEAPGNGTMSAPPPATNGPSASAAPSAPAPPASNGPAPAAPTPTNGPAPPAPASAPAAPNAAATPEAAAAPEGDEAAPLRGVAARIVERMEAEGVVSAANHVGKRDVLVGGEN